MREVVVRIDVDALDKRGRAPELVVADMLDQAAGWFRIGTGGKFTHSQAEPLRNKRQDAVPRFVGTIEVKVEEV
jgi:hypothetical protein